MFSYHSYPRLFKSHQRHPLALFPPPKVVSRKTISLSCHPPPNHRALPKNAIPPPKPKKRNPMVVLSSNSKSTPPSSPHTTSPLPPSIILTNLTQQLLLQDKLPLLVLLAGLIGPIVLPPDHLFTLPTRDVAHDVAARRHVPLAGFAADCVYHRVEEVGFAVLAAEVLG